MGKKTGRPRGAPKGNTNRLKHGRWSKASIARHRRVRELKAHVRIAIALAENEIRAEAGGAVR